jgi:hypothetical protein
LAPILPLASVGNSAWKILYVVTRTSGSTEVGLPLAATIHSSPRLTGKTGIDAVSRLPWQAGIHSTSGLTACAGKRIARTILQEFRRCSAGQRAARDRSGVAEAA